MFLLLIMIRKISGDRCSSMAFSRRLWVHKDGCLASLLAFSLHGKMHGGCRPNLLGMRHLLCFFCCMIYGHLKRLSRGCFSCYVIL